MSDRMYTLADASEAGWTYPESLYFAAFLNAVNAKVVEATGFTIWDFKDWDWTAAFYSGAPIEQVANAFLLEVDMEYATSFSSEIY